MNSESEGRATMRARVPLDAATSDGSSHAIYNLGNHHPVHLRRFLADLEQALGRKAKVELAPLPPGDVIRTCAEIEASWRDLGFKFEDQLSSKTCPRFVAWYLAYHGI